MATKNKIASPPQLVRDKEGLKAQIAEQMNKGVALLGIPVSTTEENAVRWNSFKRWDDLNYEIIAAAFDQRRHSHEYDYQYHEGIDLLALNGMRPPKRLAEEIEDDRKAIAYQLEKLKRFHDKIDLQHVAPGVVPKPLVKPADGPDPLVNLLNRFPQVALQLRHRHDNRDTLIMTDEYDVQDLLHALLQLHYEDIRPEEYTPSYAGRASRMDFLLKREKTVVEAKKTRSTLRAKEIGDELTIDIAHYRAHADCKHLVCFVYDPDRLISNPRGLEDDLRRQSTPEMTVEVFIRS